MHRFHEACASSIWTIVLAGGDGTRLRRLVRRIHGDERPKQFAAVASRRSLLRETLDRAALLSPCDRTVIVAKADHARYLVEEERQQGPMPQVLSQPADRGTAAGVLLPVRWVHARDPDGVVAIFPSDHLIVENARFIAHVAEVAALVRANPDWVVLLGARPDRAETEYGWIETGRALRWTSAGPISAVSRFWEKPRPERARTCLQKGCLWNTFVIVARAARIAEVGRRYVPQLHGRLAALDRFFGTEHERWALRQAYALTPPRNFSRDVLEPGQGELMVAHMPAVTWCDLGTPRRVFQAVRQVGLRPPWLGARRLAHDD
jgi:mannose-1-phosphate guanylyltransferase